VSPDAVLAILGMAAITFGIRLSGYLLADRLPASGLVAAWLRHIPGAVLASLVAPTVLRGSLAEWAATGTTAIAYFATRNLFAAMAAGVATVYLLRTFAGA
jgi:uncharacterized membrane protein